MVTCWATRVVITILKTTAKYLNSHVSSCSVLSVCSSVTGHPLDACLHGNITVLATFSMAKLRILPVERRETIKHYKSTNNSDLKIDQIFSIDFVYLLDLLS